MSSFLALSDLTCPPSCFLANEIPPEGATDYVYYFFPSCMLPGFAAADYATGTEIAWKVAWGATSGWTYVLFGGVIYSNKLFWRPFMGGLLYPWSTGIAYA
jgi:hypothetical protein